MADAEPISYWFTSDLFQIEPNEDDETNPRMYGKNLSSWVRQKLIEKGYEPEGVIPEDFGWLVLCSRAPYSLGVVCVSFKDYETSQPGDPPRPYDQVKWCCGIFVEVPFLKRLFGKLNTTEGSAKLDADLRKIFEQEQRIKFIDAP
jgi:hypothetical protein